MRMFQTRPRIHAMILDDGHMGDALDPDLVRRIAFYMGAEYP